MDVIFVKSGRMMMLIRKKAPHRMSRPTHLRIMIMPTRNRSRTYMDINRTYLSGRMGPLYASEHGHEEIQIPVQEKNPTRSRVERSHTAVQTPSIDTHVRTDS